MSTRIFSFTTTGSLYLWIQSFPNDSPEGFLERTLVLMIEETKTALSCSFYIYSPCMLNCILACRKTLIFHAHASNSLELIH